MAMKRNKWSVTFVNVLLYLCVLWAFLLSYLQVTRWITIDARTSSLLVSAGTCHRAVLCLECILRSGSAAALATASLSHRPLVSLEKEFLFLHSKTPAFHQALEETIMSTCRYDFQYHIDISFVSCFWFGINKGL